MKSQIHIKVLAVLFLLSALLIASVTFPQTISALKKFITDERHSVSATVRYIDDSYRGMLSFQGPVYADKGAYINLNGLMARLIGQRQMNTVIKLNNGHLIAGETSELDLTLGVTQITKLFDKQKEKGKDFLFVIAPNQISKFDKALPAGYTDYSNKNADEFIYALKENGILTLDLRDEMQNDGLDYADAFFITDHHWKPETGFWAYKKIIEYLTEEKMIQPPAHNFIDISEYEISVYENIFLGTQGRRTGIFYAGLDDFEIITPKFETDISVEIPTAKLNIKGPFNEIAYDMTAVKRDFFSSTPYSAYGHSDQSLIRYRNEYAPIDMKVMAIGDSISNIPFTFLPLIFNECDQLDMRVYKGDFIKHYSEFDPDIIIMLTSSAHHLRDDNILYDFFNDLPE